MKFQKIENFKPPTSIKPIKISLRNWRISRLKLTWIAGTGRHYPLIAIDNSYLQMLIDYTGRAGNRQWCGYSMIRWNQFFVKEQKYRATL